MCRILILGHGFLPPDVLHWIICSWNLLLNVLLINYSLGNVNSTFWEQEYLFNQIFYFIVAFNFYLAKELIILHWSLKIKLSGNTVS